ncbi:MAG: response regulator transcription factor [Burkholderiaceae bacterium]|nr:response regulator transcription factor [Burkholderiaceae bacterium]
MKALKAILVEDSPVIRENLIAALEEMTSLTVVATAADEAGALRLLSTPEAPVDIAIVDIVLVRGSGLNVLRALQAQGSPIERVVLTNHATPAMRRQCLALGASRVFDKSGEIDALIEHCLERAAEP